MLASDQTIGNMTFSVAGANGSAWTVSGQTITLSRTTGIPTISTTTSATIDSILTGTQGLQKSGSRTLTLLGNNTYSGGTWLTAGTLQVNSLSAIGTGLLSVRNSTFRYLGTGSQTTTRELRIDSGNATFSIDSASAHLTFNPTSGTRNRNLTKTGAGTLQMGGSFSGTALLTVNQGRLILTANNTHSGGTYLYAGNLQVDSTSSLGTGYLRVRSGVFDYRGTGSETTSQPLLLDTGSSTFRIQNATANLTFNPVSGTRNRALTKTGAGTLEMAGAFSGGASITVNGGRMILSGNNTHTGANQLLAGTLQINGVSGIGTGSLTIRNGAVLDYRGSGSESTSRQLNMNLGAATINVQSPSAHLTINPSSGTRNQSFTKTGDGTLQLGAGFTGGASINVNGGTLILMAASTYTGGTVVSSGRLVLNNATGSGTGTGAVTIAPSASLGGNGRLTGALVANGVVAPGNSIGTLTTGAMDFSGVSTYDHEMNTLSLTGDLMNVNGNLTIQAGAQLTLSELASATVADGSKLTLISYAGLWSGTTFAGYSQGSIFSLGSNLWQINYSDTSGGANGGLYGNFITITAVTAIPEPSAWICVAAAFAAGGLTTRRKGTRRQQSPTLLSVSRTSDCFAV
jgi:autotransporter-associated beta strand protein